MSRLKTFAIYILILVSFFIFSRIIIFIGINNTYSNIELNGELPQGVSITSAKATSVNGEVKGTIIEDLPSKYVKFNFYTDIDTLMGSYYITPTELESNNFEFYFKSNYIESYTVELTNEKIEMANSSTDFSTEEFSGYVLVAALIVLMFA